MNEKTIWKRIQNDDNKAFKEVFDLHYKVLCLYVVQFTKNMQEAEDIVQNVFIALWEKRKKIQISTSIRSYLFRCSYNLFIDQTKKEKRNDLFLLELEYNGMLNQIENNDFDQQQKIIKIKSCINNLPEKCKEILLLSKFERLKNKEIASKLDISIKTVESQIRIAFQKIRKDFS
jgi:RNA polymerase sigma-70 factor (ECF subfamily)